MNRSAPLRRTGPPRRSAGLAPTPPPARRAPLRPFSPRRLAERPTRRRVVAEVLERDGHQCQAARAVPEVACWGPLDPHEIIPRSAWAAGYLVPENVLTVCRGHHDWIGANEPEAHGYGLHGYSWERPTP